MAKVTGPLLSLEATGKLGGVLNFKRWGGQVNVRLLRKPKVFADPMTEIQLFFRSFFGDLTAVWKALGPTDKDNLDSLATHKRMSGFNLYTKEYMKQKPTELGMTRVGYNNIGNLTL